MKLSMVRCVGHKAHMRRWYIRTKYRLEILKERDQSEDLGVERIKLSKRTLMKEGARGLNSCD
jgi:hypothetical protein